MPIISVLIVLFIVGFALYMMQYAPIHPTIQHIIVAVVIFFVILWLLQVMGLWSGFGSLGSARLR